MIESRFENVALFSQRAVTGSRIEACRSRRLVHPSTPSGSSSQATSGNEAGPPDPLYIVAVASDSGLPALPGRLDPVRLWARACRRARGHRSGRCATSVRLS